MESIVKFKPLMFFKQKSLLAAKDRSKALSKEKKSGDEKALLDQMQEIRYKIEAAQNLFDMITDVDLIESCIYKLESLDVHYNYLLKQAKNKGIRCDNYKSSNISDKQSS